MSFAMRGLTAGAKTAPPVLVQLSVYADAKYVGTIARADNGSFVSGVDPWVKEDLLHYSGAEDQTGPSASIACSTPSTPLPRATTCRRR